MAHAGESSIERLLPELLAEIHGRLESFVDRLAFASACGAPSRRLMRPEAPCLLLPSSTPERVLLQSLSESADARAPDPAMRDYGHLRMANPVTGEQVDLPAVTTIPSVRRLYSGGWFCLALAPFAEARFDRGRHNTTTAGGGECWKGTFTHTAAHMRLYFYRKVVLSVIPGGGPGRRSYAAMLLLRRRFGAPAFATSEDPAWRVAPSRDGVEDAIFHQDGAFYSVTYSGDVEAWGRDVETEKGAFVSRAVAPRLAFDERNLCRKYLAAAPDGRLMAVLKYSEEEQVQVPFGGYQQSGTFTRVSFMVQVLDAARGRWEKTTDIGDLALFVGVNGTTCVSAREWAGWVYFTDDDVGEACLRDVRHSQDRYGSIPGEAWGVGVYNLQTGVAERIIAQEDCPRWPPPAWFTPSV
ncbi:unnamed protein product [Urochloa decumbens]|uniref:KIB1-4 beta-propeller domain-containing protein n=1 Tax=Urochloa decumbens TaxID=240449 RepID=A0ABC9CZX9_9POAL